MSLGFVSYNGVPINIETPLGKELMKWERKPDYRPEANPYPRMLYKAFKRADGIVECLMGEPSPDLFGSTEMGRHQKEIDMVRAWNEHCQLIVKSKDEESAAHSRGWRTSNVEAIQAEKDRETALQVAAAEFAHENRNMSEAAQREISKAEKATDEVLVDVPASRTVKKEHWKTKQAREAREAVQKAS